MQEKLRDAGVEVISSEEYLVHTSGHGCKEDIRRMFEMVKPKIVIPCMVINVPFASKNAIRKNLIAVLSKCWSLGTAMSSILKILMQKLLAEVPTDGIGG